jgi:nucleotide-binding universal stress UspA family protein
MRTLIAFDGSEHALRAIDFVCRHPHVLGDRARVTVVFVAPQSPLRVVAALGAEGSAPLPAEAERTAQPALEKLRQAGIEATLSDLTGDAGLEICELARDGGYDLIVIGSHGRGLLKRAVLGSVVERVLAHCNVPALIVR